MCDRNLIDERSRALVALERTLFGVKCAQVCLHVFTPFKLFLASLDGAPEQSDIAVNVKFVPSREPAGDETLSATIDRTFEWPDI